MTRPLDEQVVVVLGASSGNGREAALRFGERGASVVVAARNEIALARLVDEIGGDGARALALTTDATQWIEVRALADQAVERFGRIDTWVNSAAVAEYATVEQATVEEIERVIAVDLLGVVYGIKAALPHLTSQGQGTLINVSSVLGARSVPFLSSYCAAKAGIRSFSDSLRLELQRERSGVAVTTILPSSINTPLFRNARSKLVVKLRDGLSSLGIPLGPTLFPMQALRVEGVSPARLQNDLLRLGVRTVVHEGKCTKSARVSVLITARHRPQDIDRALAAVARCRAQRRVASPPTRRQLEGA